MPDHGHLSTPPELRPRLRQLLNRATAHLGVRFDLHTEPVSSAAILGRVVRYNFLNPVRANLVPDPLLWPWSTLRDVVKACVEVWTPPRRLVTTLRVRPDRLIGFLTNASDSVTSPLRLEAPAAVTPDAVRRAVASALRVPTEDAFASPLGRKLAVQTTALFARVPSAPLAQLVGISPGSVRRLRGAQSDPAALQAVRRCLSDDRLGPPQRRVLDDFRR